MKARHITTVEQMMLYKLLKIIRSAYTMRFLIKFSKGSLSEYDSLLLLLPLIQPGV